MSNTTTIRKLNNRWVVRCYDGTSRSFKYAIDATNYVKVVDMRQGAAR